MLGCGIVRMGERDELLRKVPSKEPIGKPAGNLRRIALAPFLLPKRIAEFEILPLAAK